MSDRSESEGIICCENDFGVVFDETLTNGFRGDIEFGHSWVECEELDVVVVADLLSDLRENLFFESVDGFADLNLYYYLLFFSY